MTADMETPCIGDLALGDEPQLGIGEGMEGHPGHPLQPRAQAALSVTSVNMVEFRV
jgi:hypothetical protein